MKLEKYNDLTLTKKIKDIENKIDTLNNMLENGYHVTNGLDIGMSLTNEIITDSSNIYQYNAQFYEFNHNFNCKNLTKIIKLLIENLEFEIAIYNNELLELKGL